MVESLIVLTVLCLHWHLECAEITILVDHNL